MKALYYIEDLVEMSPEEARQVERDEFAELGHRVVFDANGCSVNVGGIYIPRDKLKTRA